MVDIYILLTFPEPALISALERQLVQFFLGVGEGYGKRHRVALDDTRIANGLSRGILIGPYWTTCANKRARQIKAPVLIRFDRPFHFTMSTIKFYFCPIRRYAESDMWATPNRFFRVVARSIIAIHICRSIAVCGDCIANRRSFVTT